MAECCYIPKRYILVSLAHFGFFVVYALRVNLSVALVAMVNDTYAHVNPTVDPECSRNLTGTEFKKGGKFNWDQNQQGIILSSFFYGYLITQLPGGLLGNRYGGKWVFAIGVLCTSVFTLLTPLAVKTNFYLFIAIRVLEGIGEGVTFPAMHALLGKWSPSNEITRLSTLSYSGTSSGTVVSLPVSSILANSSFLGGWPSVFYVFGILGVIWFILWALCISESPLSHSTISREERIYILQSQKCLDSDSDVRKIPWKHILTSVHVWAIVVAQFCSAWVWYLILTDLPSYFQQVLNFNLMENGFLSALPFLASFVISISSGCLADYLARRCMSMRHVRRLLSMTAAYSSAACLVLASFARCDQMILSVACMVLASGLLALTTSGCNVNHFDLSPRFAGILMAITNFFATVAGSIAPLVTGYFTDNEPTRKQFRKVFLIAAGISVFGGTFFGIFVSGEQQHWNNQVSPVSSTEPVNTAAIMEDSGDGSTDINNRDTDTLVYT